jgi:hypothetical protein
MQVQKSKHPRQEEAQIKFKDNYDKEVQTLITNIFQCCTIVSAIVFLGITAYLYKENIPFRGIFDSIALMYFFFAGCMIFLIGLVTVFDNQTVPKEVQNTTSVVSAPTNSHDREDTEPHEAKDETRKKLRKKMAASH